MIKKIFLFFHFLTSFLIASDLGGLKIATNADLFGKFGDRVSNRLDVREAEIMLYAPIDHLFDGVTSLAAHQEGGTAFFEIHECHIGSTKLIPHSRFRVGQFYLGIGRLNQIHRHDWPFSEAPKIHKDLMGEEGILDTGVEYSILIPASFYLDLTLGLTNGWNLGHSHSQGTKPLLPTHYARVVTAAALFSEGNIQSGVSYLGRRASDGTQTILLGTDQTAKWKEMDILKVLIQSEVWFRSVNPVGEKILGFYFYPQYGLSETLLLGLRLDGSSILSLKDATGKTISNFDYGILPSLTYKPSEFSQFRMTFGFTGNLTNNKETTHEHSISLQSIFNLGAHPVHEF